MATVSANKLELLQIADAVAREKAIDRKIVLGAMEDAIAKAARSRYGSETEVRAEIDPKSGELHLSRHMLVVETVENPAMQISLEDARRRDGLVRPTGRRPRLARRWGRGLGILGAVRGRGGIQGILGVVRGRGGGLDAPCASTPMWKAGLQRHSGVEDRVRPLRYPGGVLDRRVQQAGGIEFLLGVGCEQVIEPLGVLSQ